MEATRTRTHTHTNLSMVSLQFPYLLLILGLLYFAKVTTLIEGYTYMPCNGSIAECDEESEMMMESDISRRILQNKKYISPGTLKRDQPVCGGGERGEAYSKTGGCLPPSSNPEQPGCEKYYRCRSR
ncbi:hypothetical protein UlMin_010487 [Ulmus minor]